MARTIAHERGAAAQTKAPPKRGRVGVEHHCIDTSDAATPWIQEGVLRRNGDLSRESSEDTGPAGKGPAGAGPGPGSIVKGRSLRQPGRLRVGAVPFP